MLAATIIIGMGPVAAAGGIAYVYEKADGIDVVTDTLTPSELVVVKENGDSVSYSAAAPLETLLVNLQIVSAGSNIKCCSASSATQACSKCQTCSAGYTAGCSCAASLLSCSCSGDCAWNGNRALNIKILDGVDGGAIEHRGLS